MGVLRIECKLDKGLMGSAWKILWWFIVQYSIPVLYRKLTQDKIAIHSNGYGFAVIMRRMHNDYGINGGYTALISLIGLIKY